MSFSPELSNVQLTYLQDSRTVQQWSMKDLSCSLLYRALVFGPMGLHLMLLTYQYDELFEWCILGNPPVVDWRLPEGSYFVRCCSQGDCIKFGCRFFDDIQDCLKNTM